MTGISRVLSGQRFRIGLIATLCGAVLFWLALRSEGCDWFISETHADAMFTGLREFHEYPFFSFAFNGGSYFLQDPQSNLFSPVVPLTLLVGPSVALRLLNGLWGILGVLFFFGWMRRRVRPEAALLGGVASVTSLGVLWRIAVGNDMFAWHLGLPALLWAAERVLRERTLSAMLWLGFAVGILTLGPTFGSVTYLFLPVGIVFAVFATSEWLSERPSARQTIRALALIFGALVVAALIASPKLACWSRFSMSRPKGDWGPIPLKAALRYLFDFSAWENRVVIPDVRVVPHRRFGWGLEETAVALQPLGAVLALAGAATLPWLRKQRGIGAFALALVALGLVLSCSWYAFDSFRAYSHQSFRVVQRFLAVSAFGLSILAALGADALLARLPLMKGAFTWLSALCMLGSVVWWVHMASQFSNEHVCNPVQPNAIQPFSRIAEERQSADQVTSFDTLRRFPGLGRDFLKGGGYTDGFLIVGNDFAEDLWRSKAALPVVVDSSGSAAVKITHLAITVDKLAPGASLKLRVRSPAFGVSIKTVPASSRVTTTEHGGYLIIGNTGDQTIDTVTIRAKLPISVYWFVLAGLSSAGALVALFVLGRSRGTPR